MDKQASTTQPQREGGAERVGSSGTLPAGTRVGKYEIQAVLGQGAFGITYRALDTQLGRDVAIKEYLPTAFAIREPDCRVLPRSTQVAEDFRWGRQRFLDEAKTLALLEHAPGIARVHDFLEANGTAYMVMALVRGETLETRLRRDRVLSAEALRHILHPLLDGLERVHEAGYIHRDIKPANILVDGAGQPTLIDFGASRAALQGRTQRLTAVYTPGYAAFEQFTSAEQGPWTDIYGLGATLYHAVTGGQPPGAIERAGRDRIVPAAVAGKGRYPARLLAGIDAALRVGAADRPQTVAAWRRMLPAPADTAPDPGAASLRRRLAGVAAALAMLGLAAGGYFWLHPDAEAEAWSRARAAATEQAYRDYLDAYPSGRHADAARTAVAGLESRRRLVLADEQGWRRAKQDNTAPAYRLYLATYPDGRYAGEAKSALADAEADDRAWAGAAAAHTVEAYRRYLEARPAGRRAGEARTLIAALQAQSPATEARRAEDEAWRDARAANTIVSLRAYLDRYSSGRYAGEARQALSAMVAAAPVLPGGTWRVTLSSQRSEDDARAAWERLQRAYPDLLGKFRIQPTRADLGDKGVFYRVQLGPFEEAVARELCTLLKERGGDCYFTRQ